MKKKKKQRINVIYLSRLGLLILILSAATVDKTFPGRLKYYLIKIIYLKVIFGRVVRLHIVVAFSPEIIGSGGGGVYRVRYMGIILLT